MTLAFWLLPLTSTSSMADIHYVSKLGSKTYPYDSWATATDSVHVAIAASSEWDTVQLSSNLFDVGSLSLKKGMVLLGAGSDSTTIRHNGSTLICVKLADSSRVKSLHIDGIVDTAANGDLTFRLSAAIYAGTDTSGSIDECEISNTQYGLYFAETDRISAAKRVRVANNRFRNFRCGIDAFDASSVILNNYFLVNHDDIGDAIHLSGRNATVEGNTIWREAQYSSPLLYLEQPISVLIRNNIFVSATQSTGFSIELNRTSPHYPTTGRIENNLLIGSEAGIVSYGGDVSIKNNIIMRTRLGSLVYDTGGTSPGQVGFNLYWENDEFQINPDTLARLAEGCVLKDPMFADSTNFYLQAYSPAINSGDSLILDVDGSRSDIGPYGGPNGHTYLYVDLPPRTPQSLVASVGSTVIDLHWPTNPEADLMRYEIFRDTTSIFQGTPANYLDSTSTDTLYRDTSVLSGTGYYYRIKAIDSQGNASLLSNEVFVISTGLDDYDDGPTIVGLLPVYPNPFNSRMAVPIQVQSERSSAIAPAVVEIFDVLGRRVHTLWNGPLPTGVHTCYWDGIGIDGRRRASGMYFVRLQTGTTSQLKKVTLIR